MTSRIAGSEPTARTWRTFAACREVDAELFFPVATSGRAYERQVLAAKSVCAGCTVVSQCLAEAIELLPHGIAGGLTADERRAAGRPRGRRVEAHVELPASTRSENAAIGAALLAAGGSPTAVARRCRVTGRTVYRWKAGAAGQQERTGL
jgi:hypothetical protein